LGGGSFLSTKVTTVFQCAEKSKKPSGAKKVFEVAKSNEFAVILEHVEPEFTPSHERFELTLGLRQDHLGFAQTEKFGPERPLYTKLNSNKSIQARETRFKMSQCKVLYPRNPTNMKNLAKYPPTLSQLFLWQPNDLYRLAQSLQDSTKKL